MMKKLAMWLNNHAIVLGDSLKANVLHLWCILISAVLVTAFTLLGWRGDAMYYLFMVLFLGGSVIPPVVEAVRALIKHDKWTPWYWFPIVIGNVIGVIIAAFVCWAFGIIKM